MNVLFPQTVPDRHLFQSVFGQLTANYRAYFG